MIALLLAFPSNWLDQKPDGPDLSIHFHCIGAFSGMPCTPMLALWFALWGFEQ